MAARLRWTAASKTGTTVTGYRVLEDGVQIASGAPDTFTAGAIPGYPYAWRDETVTARGVYTVEATFADTSTAVSQVAGLFLVWADEFDGAAGAGPDSTRWTARVGGGGWGNGELQYYRAENARLDGNGSLAIVAKAEVFGGHDYTSARLDSEKKVSHSYGRVEARMKLPVGTALWPAFWMMGDTGQPWPARGEIDVMEAVNAMPFVAGALHGPTTADATVKWSISTRWDLPGGLGDGLFHVFAVEWSPDTLHFIVDDVYYGSLLRSQMPSGNDWVYNDRVFFYLLNLAVGGTYTGNATPDPAAFPATLLIDYVRVYRLEQYVPVLPKTHTIRSDFSSRQEFRNWDAERYLTAGLLRINTLASFPTLITQRRSNFTGSSVRIQLVDLPAVGAGGTRAGVQVIAPGANNRLEIFWRNALIYSRVVTAGTIDEVSVSTTDKHLRMRHDGTSIIYETSVDGVAWTVRRTIAAPAFDLTNVDIGIFSGFTGTETAPGFATFDNLNPA